MGSVLWCKGLAALRLVGSSQTRGRTCVPYISRWILIHCTWREVLYFPLSNNVWEKGNASDLDWFTDVQILALQVEARSGWTWSSMCLSLVWTGHCCSRTTKDAPKEIINRHPGRVLLSAQAHSSARGLTQGSWAGLRATPWWKPEMLGESRQVQHGGK